jgi:hypothetical protein
MQTLKEFIAEEQEEQNLVDNMAAAGVNLESLNECEMDEMTLEQLFAEHQKIRDRNAAKSL